MKVLRCTVFCSKSTDIAWMARIGIYSSTILQGYWSVLLHILVIDIELVDRYNNNVSITVVWCSPTYTFKLFKHIRWMMHNFVCVLYQDLNCGKEEGKEKVQYLVAVVWRFHSLILKSHQDCLVPKCSKQEYFSLGWL